MAKKKTLKSPPAAPPLADALTRFQPLLDPAEFAALQEELKRPLFPALRANPLKVEPQAALAQWAARYGWETRPVPFCPDGRWILSAPQPVSQTPEHRLGFYYIQDAASMLPPELFDFDGLEEPLVLDMAASPGGKTTHLTARTGDRGLVLANDSSSDRIQALRLVLQTWGAANTAVTHYPGERFGPWFPETFDRILLDAPCSMQGLRSTESHPMRGITAHEEGMLARRQANLLASAFQALRTGGQLVYSTCTLEVNEDEAVLDVLLRRFPGAVQIDSLESRLPAPAPALTDGFDPQVGQAARLWPHRFGTAGFFAARITKLAAVETAPQEPPSRPLEKNGLEPLRRKEQNALLDGLLQAFGINYLASLDDQRLELWRRGGMVFALPELFLSRFGDLPFQAVGMLVGEDTPEGFQVSHEWAARYGMQSRTGRLALDDSQAAAWWRGEDIPGQPAAAALGHTALMFDSSGRLLGRGKVQRDRVKNLLPRRLVG